MAATRPHGVDLDTRPAGAAVPRWLAVLILACAVPMIEAAEGPSAIAASPGYNRDIRPILAENCFACHGPDAGKRKAGLALQARARAVEALADGVRAIVPGDPAASELIRRIASADVDTRMPPPQSGKHLGVLQIQALTRWVAQGAAYQEHWAYLPPSMPAAPAAAQDPWVITPIDAIILDGLRAAGLQPAPPADRATLIRRLSFDLDGLPPTAAEAEAFAADGDARAYERLVDRLMSSPRYGERMAVWWLDLVRYADSAGYQSDNPRNVTPYRDWVIGAFNADLPFDQFTREQIAGDLLPSATLKQRVASGYNRLIMSTEEGGAQPKEYESRYAADRVRNLASVWLGSTMQCCECHDHKFDPFSQRDFYAMEAFFADIQEAAIGRREDGEPVPDADQLARLAELDRGIATTQAAIDAPSRELDAAQGEWEARQADQPAPTFGTWYHIGPFMVASARAAFDGAFIGEPTVDLSAEHGDHLRWRQEPAWQDGEVHHFVGDNSATYLYRTVECRSAQRIHLSLGSDDTIAVWLNGHQVLSHEVYRGVAPDQERLDLDFAAGINQLLHKNTNGGGDYAYYFKATAAVPADIAAALAAKQRSAQQAAAIAAYFHGIAPQLAGLRASLEGLHAQRAAILAAVPRCLVPTSGPPRRVSVKARGNWMDESGAECQPSVPRFLRQISRQGRATRLDLADWLVAPDNPLVARVLVNRLWQLLFGTGLVKTLGDFGTQGDAPAQPELLDFLARDLADHGWDLKRTIRMIALSSAYRQASQAGPLLARDPENRWLGRQGRFRIAAEFVRDTALSLGGLLVERVGGPSVAPYQPPGYWMHLNFPPREWVDSRGDDQYRRGLYTFWQRTFLHPSLMAFDAPSREECCVERPQSDTPQQALVLLNDPTYVEAARAFAELALRQPAASDAARIAWAFMRAVSRPPNDQESTLLLGLLAAQRALYREHPQDAPALIAVGLHRPPPGTDLPELAAWTAVTRTLLNLLETITRS